MSKDDWDSPPDSPEHTVSDMFGTSEAVAAEPPAPVVVEPPATAAQPEQPQTLQVSEAMQVKHETLKMLFKQTYDRVRAPASHDGAAVLAYRVPQPDVALA